MGYFRNLFGKSCGPPSKDEFARWIMEDVRKAGETADISYDPNAFSLHKQGPEQPVLDLANAYTAYCAASERDRNRMFRKWIREWFAPEHEEADVTDLGERSSE